MNRPSANLKLLLEQYEPYDKYDTQYKRQFLQFLETGANQFDRSNLIAHFVADAWILSPDLSQVVLIEHRDGGSWRAPGGHCDSEADTYEVAIREAYEETGLKGLTPLSSGIFDINTGLVPFAIKNHGPEPEHLNLVICFAFLGDINSDLRVSDESTGLKWVSLLDIPKMKYPPQHLRRVEKTLKRWGL